ncbi:MAG: hypothetical protein M3065_02325 [Actinomycetota bacterium]|nr:hypothetical protein [Actinomycetota bacterium]
MSDFNQLVGTTSGQCGPRPQTTPPLAGEQGRCGLGPRLPLAGMFQFDGRVNEKLILDPITGQPVRHHRWRGGRD